MSNVHRIVPNARKRSNAEKKKIKIQILANQHNFIARNIFIFALDQPLKLLLILTADSPSADNQSLSRPAHVLGAEAAKLASLLF